MAEPTIPSFLTVEPRAIEELVNAGGMKDPPQGAPHTVLYGQAWAEWVAAHGTAFKWPSFVDLFQAQNNDGNPDSLSAKDLQKITAEIKFVRTHGYPEAIIPNPSGLGILLKMPDSSIWEETIFQGQTIFTKVEQRGRLKMETDIANGTLKKMDETFNAASPEQQLAMKRTMGRGQMTGVSSGKGSTVDFAGQEYVLGNSNSKIAYKSDGPVAKYHLAQPQNGCVAAAILNGGIFQGKLTKKPEDLEGFYKKLKAMQGSVNGRISIDELMEAIHRGEIPGLAAREVKPSELAGLIRGKKPVMALVPYFYGHAIAILNVKASKGTYKAVDTVTGMVVEETMKTVSGHEQEPAAKSRAEIVSDALAASEVTIDPATMEKVRQFLLTHPEILERISAIRQDFFPHAIPRTFYSIEITDPVTFLAWVNTTS